MLIHTRIHIYIYIYIYYVCVMILLFLLVLLLLTVSSVAIHRIHQQFNNHLCRTCFLF